MAKPALPEGWGRLHYANGDGLCHAGDWLFGPSGNGCCEQCHPQPWVEFPSWNISKRDACLVSISASWDCVARVNDSPTPEEIQDALIRED